MEEFKGNSFSNRQEENSSIERKKIDTVTTNVKEKNTSELSKLKNGFFAEDASSVGKYLVDSVLIPGFQKLITDIVKNGIDWLVYGTKGTTKNSNGLRNISYSSYYDRHTNLPPIPADTYRRSSVLTVSELIFADRGEAEEVLLRMCETLQHYQMVSVADYYDMCGRKANFTDQKYGWRDLSTAEVVRVRDGYSINFPKIIVLE